jgi:hypothetical protein
MDALKESIISLLLGTKREGMDKLIQYLIDEGFFTAPASTRFHGCHYGGLAEHSYGVYTLLNELSANIKIDEKVGYGQMPIKITHNNLIIAGLLHDLCKIGAYQRTKKDDGWANNSKKDKGHAKLSITRIKKFIDLNKIEEMMIRFHMGMYGCIEFQDDPENINGEYHLRGDTTPEMKKAMSPEEKKLDQKRRYGKSLSNAYYHNPICKIMSIADELETARAKAKDAL